MKKSPYLKVRVDADEFENGHWLETCLFTDTGGEKDVYCLFTSNSELDEGGMSYEELNEFLDKATELSNILNIPLVIDEADIAGFFE